MKQEPAHVYVGDLRSGYDQCIEEGFSFCGLQSLLDDHPRIVLKPNLTFPSYRPGVMTSPEAIEAAIRYLKQFTDSITICESDSGGYNAFSMTEVFRETGLQQMADRYNVKIVNLTHEESSPLRFEWRHRQFSVPIPRLLNEETDLFITMPVPKIHMNAGISMSIKNQWGAIQNPEDRLRLHPYFKKVVYEVNKSLKRSMTIMDGRYGLNRSGPMEGDAVELNWLLVSDDVFSADFVGCKLIGIDPRSVAYLNFIFEQEGTALEKIVLNIPLASRCLVKPFYLNRKWTDYPGLLAFRSRLLAYVAYHSPLAGFLHWLLYLFRKPFYDYAEARKVRRNSNPRQP